MEHAFSRVPFQSSQFRSVAFTIGALDVELSKFQAPLINRLVMESKSRH